MTSKQMGEGASVTFLAVHGERSLVQQRAGGITGLERELHLGFDALVRDVLRHAPPLPLELEHAIEQTEAFVMPLARDLAGGTELVMQGPGAGVIAKGLAAAGMPDRLLSLEDLESVFNRLVRVSEGFPPSQESLVTDARFFASVLILREFMHHLNFLRVTLERKGVA